MKCDASSLSYGLLLVVVVFLAIRGLEPLKEGIRKFGAGMVSPVVVDGMKTSLIKLKRPHVGKSIVKIVQEPRRSVMRTGRAMVPETGLIAGAPAEHYSSLDELSGGQRKRIPIARARGVVGTREYQNPLMAARSLRGYRRQRMNEIRDYRRDRKITQRRESRPSY